MKVDTTIRDFLISQGLRKIYLEGNLLKVIESEPDDSEFQDYLDTSIERDRETRKKRLEITKQIQNQNTQLKKSHDENARINDELKLALKKAEDAKKISDAAKLVALNDLDVLQKQSQNELVGVIVRVALAIIACIGLITTILYAAAIFADKTTQIQILSSTWSNMFGILLTNSFSIVGTIMGVKYATERPNKK
jgi:ABC-type glutathione transport system ATPase component